ncbi:MAG: DUF167 domain-containing protein [Actinomycetota bacterium]|nr:DUF167 domain-containing protein [Actinomycetota bacterium]
MRGIDVREHGEGVVIAVQVRPRSRAGIELTDAGLVIRVTAPPEKGRATEEARRALAEALDVPPTSVSLRSGPASRRKSYTVQGLDVTVARRRLLERVRG